MSKQNNWETSFREKFVRDDGLMDKYTYDKDGDTVPTAEAILDFISSQIKLAEANERTRIEEVVEEELELSCVDDRLLGKTNEFLEGYNTSSDRWRTKRDDLLQAIRKETK